MCKKDIEEDGWGGFYEDDSVIESVKEKVDFLDVLEHYGIEYYKSGSDRVKVRCPFHSDGNERTPSLNISLDTNLFKCFGCNVGGSIIQFVMLLKGVVRNDAIKELMAISGMTDGDIDEFEVIRRDPEETVLPHVFRAGVMIREALKAAPEDKLPQWEAKAKRWFRTLDYYMLELDDDDWQTAKDFCDKMESFIIRNGGKNK